MSTYIKRNTQTEGPFTDAELRDKLGRGEITAQTPAWKMGMPQWKTIGDLFQVAPASAIPPKANSPLPQINSLFEHPEQVRNEADVIDRLVALSNQLLGLLRNRLGMTARSNHTFYAYRVVTTAIQRLRLELLNGGTLTSKGEAFAVSAAAYLASLAALNWHRRGLQIGGFAQFTPGSPDNHIFLFAERTRNGQYEAYSQDFLEDMYRILLMPPQAFPSIHGRFYMLDSLTLPSPEYLYQYGVHLLQSPRAGGNWPRGEKIGGTDEDFNASRVLLVNDLHEDCGLPRDDARLRELSWWIVFPPYGWDMNDGQDYNMMTVFSSISHKKIVPRETGIDYLRALLNSQALDVRNLAARCLMVYRVPPRNAQEAMHYYQAMNSRDYQVAVHSMAKYQHQMEQVQLTQEWFDQTQRERNGWLTQTSPTLSMRSQAENDPDYVTLSKLPDSEIAQGIQGLEALMKRYPNDWVLKALHAAQLMRGPDPQRGEMTLRELIKNPPDCFEGHSRLGTLLKRQGRFDEAMAIYEDAIARWPWNHQAVDACMWIITEGMVKR